MNTTTTDTTTDTNTVFAEFMASVDDDCTLVNGDCKEVLPYIASGSVDLIVTDPPYSTGSGGKYKPEGTAAGVIHKAGWGVSVLKENDGKLFAENSILPREYMAEFYRVLKPDADCYVMCNAKNMEAFLKAGREAGFRLHNILAWKKNTVIVNRWYGKNIEFTLYFYKGRARKIKNLSSTMVFEAPNPRKKRHPTEKPVSLMRHYIENSSSVGDYVLDPFMGSGTTGVACEATGRHFFGIELGRDEFNVAHQRLIPDAEIIETRPVHQK